MVKLPDEINHQGELGEYITIQSRKQVTRKKRSWPDYRKSIFFLHIIEKRYAELKELLLCDSDTAREESMYKLC